jgi:hypothetical protein
MAEKSAIPVIGFYLLKRLIITARIRAVIYWILKRALRYWFRILFYKETTPAALLE